jgi:hypothetical protein
MKNPTKLVFPHAHNRLLTAFTVIAMLLAAAWSARAQFTLISGTDALNIYFNDGFSTYTGTLNPISYLNAGTGTPVNPADLNPGSELTSTFFSAAAPGAIGSSYFTGTMATANSSAEVNYEASPFVGSNNVSQTSLTPYGMTASILNPASGTAELRLDWTSRYTFSTSSGPVPTAAGLYLPLGFSVNNWMAVSGQLSYYDVTSSATSVATVTFGGDYSAPADYPASLSALAPNATFFGYKTPGLTGGGVVNNVPGTAINLANGDIVEVVGYLDILVDPGSVQLTIQPAPSPTIGNVQISVTNLVIQAANGLAGVTYVTRRSTLVSAPLSTWLPVATNISSTTGNFTLIATNAVAPANQSSFYILQAE